MIYLFDESKTLTGTVRDEHVRSLLYDREKNGMYDISAEIPVIAYHQGKRYNLHTVTKDAVFLGHYDLEGRFQLHKIAGYDVNSDTIAILGVHIFFDEAKAGAIIKDRRYIDREVSAGARDAFAEIGWQMADYDVSPTRTYNFYNVSPLEARAILIETFGFEFDYWIDFDGKKISGKYFSVKKQIGQDVGKRYTYDKHTNTGHHVLELTAETDYSEVFTAVIGRGRGEEIEDTGGYGRRIEYTDISWSKPNRPLNKPRGSRVLIDPEATQAFGYVQEDGTITPRTAVVEFSDIEEQSELLEASYDWLVEHRHPKLVFDVNVADGDGLELGDTVYIKYNEIGLNMAVRVGKVIDDLKSGERQVQLGDVAYFKPGRSNRDIKRSIRQERRDASNRIYQLKLEFDERFDNTVNQMRDDYEQALIDAHAEIEAAEVRMTERINSERDALNDKIDADIAQARSDADTAYGEIDQRITNDIEGVRTDLSSEFNTAVSESEQRAAEERSRIETEVSGAIESTRTDMISRIETEGSEARDYAMSEIEAKEQQYTENWDARDADIQQTIETVVGGSVDGLDTNLLDVNSRLLQTSDDLIERINNIDTQSFNLIRGSRFDEPALFDLWGGAYVVDDEGDIPFVRLGDAPNNIPFVQFFDNTQLEEDQQYTLTVEYRTEDVSELDYLRIFPVSGGNSNLIPFADNNGPYELETDGTWHRMIFRFTPTFSVDGGIGIGTNFVSGDETRGVIDIRLPYLTDGNNTQWVFHPSDNYSSIATAMQRLGEFEGRIEDNKAMILGELEDAREDLTQRLSEAQADIDNLNFETRNLLPLVRSAWEVGGIWTTGSPSDEQDRFRTKEAIEVVEGETYTFSDESLYLSAISQIRIFVYRDGDFQSYRYINRGDSASFTADGNEVRISIVPISGFSPTLDYIEHPDGRIKMKLERGTKRSEFTYAPEDTRHKIIQLNDSIEFIDGELEGMLRRTEIEPINDKITEFETNFEANAETLGLLQEKTELHDGEITTWSNLTESTADEVSRVLKRVSDTEDGLERAETDISVAAGEMEVALSRITVTEDDITEANAVIEANAEGLSTLLTRTSEAEEAIADISVDVGGITADFASYKEDVDGEVGTLSAQVASYEASVDGFRADVGTLQGDIDDVDTWIADKGAVIDGTAEAISARVWMDDVKGIGANLIPMSEPSWETGGIWASGNLSAESDRIRLRDVIPVREGQYYTFSDDSTYDSRVESIRVFVYKNGERVFYRNVPRLGQVTFLAEGDELRVSLIPLSGFSIPLSMISEADERFKMKLEVGDEATPMMDALAQLEKHTDFVLRSDGFFLGGNYVGGDHYSTAIVGSANGIDIIAEEMRVTGDLLVQGDVEAYALDVVEGNFARLWADEFEAITIDVEDINGITAYFEDLMVDDANIERLVSEQVFTEAITAQVGNFVDVNAGDIVTSGLSANIISADHIDTDTLDFSMISGEDALIERLVARSAFIDSLAGLDLTFSDGTIGNLESAIIRANVIKGNHIDSEVITGEHLRVDSAMVDKLVADDAFIDSIKTLNIEAVRGDIKKFTSEYFESSMIRSEWISGGRGLFDKVFINDAMVRRLVTKSAFVRSLNTITIDTDQITIRRPDGVALINNGMLRPTFDIPTRQHKPNRDTEFTGVHYRTTSSEYRRVEHFYTSHRGRTLVVAWAARLSSLSPSNSEYMDLRVSGFGSYNPIRKDNRDNNPHGVYVTKDGDTYYTMELDLGRPNYRVMQGYFEFRRRPNGNNPDNQVEARILAVYMKN